MTDVIEAIERRLNEGASVVDALKMAEWKYGWRMVPVEPTREIVASILDHWIDFCPGEVWHQAVGGAPRPWAEPEQ